ncbi:MAG: hypothetical protein U9P42_11185 [Candidatus Fermentibacteria bacterium]|nr:hypothetical protein [Candidatus Fermentibacteria bacterium]
MQYVALSIGGLLFVAFLVVVFDSFFLHAGAKLAGIRSATFGKAVKASIACALATLLLAIIFSWIPVAGTGLGFLIGLALTILVLQASYNTSFGKAFLLWVFNVAAQILAVVLAVVLFSGVLAAIN